MLSELLRSGSNSGSANQLLLLHNVSHERFAAVFFLLIPKRNHHGVNYGGDCEHCYPALQGHHAVDNTAQREEESKGKVESEIML